MSQPYVEVVADKTVPVPTGTFRNNETIRNTPWPALCPDSWYPSERRLSWSQGGLVCLWRI